MSIFDEEPAVIQFMDDETGAIKAEYVRADIYDELAAAMRAQRITEKALEGMHLVEKERATYDNADPTQVDLDSGTAVWPAAPPRSWPDG